MRNFITCTTPNIIRMIESRKMRWSEAKRNTCRVLVGKPERKRPLRRPLCRWVYNIKMDLRKIGWDGPVDGPCEHSNEPSGSLKCWEVLE
jgi:hypothetical protein